ncbi:MAG: hypothetical protein ACYTJ0_12640 [Planctomycetota bacterium]|jgi:hypothetical protein
MNDEHPTGSPTPTPPEPPPPAAPPQRGGPLPPRRGGSSVWPVVIGTLAIVFGAGSMLGYGCLGTAGMLMISVMSTSFEQMAQSNPQMQIQVAQFDVLSNYMVPSLVSNLVAGLLGIVLLIGGIGVVGRRSYGAKATVVWAILKMLYALPAVYLAYRMGMDQFEAMEEAAAGQNVPAAAGGVFSFLRIFGPVGAVLQMLWLWALPLFLLIWFARMKVRTEVATWAAPPASAA